MKKQTIIYSVIIPVYNEEECIQSVITELYTFLQKNIPGKFEIIAINDGSGDSTPAQLLALNLKYFRWHSHPYNKGYGAALKTGVAKALGEYVLFYDSDGQHRPQDLLNIIRESDNYDMVVGSREGYQGPAWRQPGKKLITALANYLVQYKIPDLNSGLRLVRRDLFLKFEHLFPQGFSLSTTISLTFIKHGFSVKYIPIAVKKRIGKSTVKIRDGFKTINLVVRMIMLFSPMRIFGPFSLLFFLFSMISFYMNALNHFNISDGTILFLIATIIVFLIGLLADQLASLRREIKL